MQSLNVSNIFIKLSVCIENKFEQDLHQHLILNITSCTPETYTWQDTLDIINDHGHAQHWPKSTKGTPGEMINSTYLSLKIKQISYPITRISTLPFFFFLNIFFISGSGKSVKQNLYDNSKSIEYLEFEYHSFDSTILDMSSSLIELSKKW